MTRSLLHRAPLQRAVARLLTGLWLLLTAALLAPMTAAPLALAATETKPLPAFRHGVAEAWLNSRPLTAADLRGKVLLIDLFTTA